MNNEASMTAIKLAVRFLYDIQKLRIAGGNRAHSAFDEEALDEMEPIEISEEDQAFIAKVSESMLTVEHVCALEVARRLKGNIIYERFLKLQKGCGPRMSGYLIAETDITKCDTPSQLWRWFGLAVIDGHAERRVKGEKAHYDPERKAKVVKVLAESLIKQRSMPWYDTYAGYKHRKATQMMPVCMACNGTGRYTEKPQNGKRAAVKSSTEPGVCSNCGGTGGPAPWGRSNAHRHAAAVRFMVKQFLLAFWREYRLALDLPVRPGYAEEKLGMPPHEINYVTASACASQKADRQPCTVSEPEANRQP